MIIDYFMTAIKNLILLIVECFPGFTEGFFSVLDSFSGLVDLVNVSGYFLPLGTMATCLGVIIAVHGINQSWFSLNWLIKRLRGG